VTRRFILTAPETRAAEAAAIAAGTPDETLMERAGLAAAEAIRRFAGPMPALVLCGPGNNGGDGYVVARVLREWGVPVRVAVLASPESDAAKAARQRWGNDVAWLDDAESAPLLVDALLGTGLTRPLDEPVSGLLAALAEAARLRAAVDLPSGVATDDGAILSPVPHFDLTVTFASLKPAHLLEPAASRMGRLVVADIGLQAHSRLERITRPTLPPPGPQDHKYTRGYVAVIGGDMPGASALAATAALGAGAGYVRLVAGKWMAGVPSAIVQSQDGALEDSRIGAIAIGPGLGQRRHLLEQALASGRPLVLDAEALRLLPPGQLPTAEAAILTPHHGEFDRLFGKRSGSKVDRARAAAEESGAVIVYKGADTVIAEPAGRAAIADPASHWLASAGTGDVLTGIVAAMRARGLPAFEAACAGVWLHGRAAALAGPGLIADDLCRHLPTAVAECL
jgi:hydroxyethylthiazole kinase-like uncharacterized protein yjeF